MMSMKIFSWNNNCYERIFSTSPLVYESVTAVLLSSVRFEANV